MIHKPAYLAQHAVRAFGEKDRARRHDVVLRRAHAVITASKDINAHDRPVAVEARARRRARRPYIDALRLGVVRKPAAELAAMDKAPQFTRAISAASGACFRVQLRAGLNLRGPSFTPNKPVRLRWACGAPLVHKVVAAIAQLAWPRKPPTPTLREYREAAALDLGRDRRAEGLPFVVRLRVVRGARKELVEGAGVEDAA